ncbi:MAG: hypothetical protein MZV65_13430 [Chromatiales bacterium]|nr:hypothetical protein [Chromatiales bacterium]
MSTTANRRSKTSGPHSPSSPGWRWPSGCAILRSARADLGLALQSELGFKRAVASRQPRVIAVELQRQFQQYFVTANIINLERLVMYGSDYRLIAGATATSAESSEWSPGCGDAIAYAYPRSGVQRLHTVTGLCTSPRGTRYFGADADRRPAADRLPRGGDRPNTGTRARRGKARLPGAPARRRRPPAVRVE